MCGLLARNARRLRAPVPATDRRLLLLRDGTDGNAVDGAGVPSGMDTPTIPESHLDLLDAQTAILATIGPDGRPQLSAVWFLRHGDELRVSLNSSRQKVKNLRANPAVTLFVHDQHAPTRYLEVRGDAVLEDDPDYQFASRVGEKYGTDLRAFDGDNAHRVVLSIHPSRINAVDMLTES